MDSYITFLIEVAVQPGNADALKQYLASTAEKAEKEEKGTIMYAWSFNSTESEAIVIEQYADAAAFVAHAQNVDTTEVAKIASFKKITVCGHLPPELSARVEAMGAEIYAPMNGLIGTGSHS